MSDVVTASGQSFNQLEIDQSLELLGHLGLAYARDSDEFSRTEFGLSQPCYSRPNPERVASTADQSGVLVDIHGSYAHYLIRNTHKALTPLRYYERVEEGYRTYVRPKQGAQLPTEGRRVAWSPGREYDLLAGGAELLDLGVLSARSSAAAERAKTGQDLDELDRESLTQLATLLESAARAVEFFGTNGQGGFLPTGALAAQLDVAIDTVAVEMGEATDTTDLAKDLRDFANDAIVFASEKTPSDPDRAITFFRGLSSSILRETGRIGERTSSL